MCSFVCSTDYKLLKKETREDSNMQVEGPDLLTSAVNIKASCQNLRKASWGLTLLPNCAWKFTGL